MTARPDATDGVVNPLLRRRDNFAHHRNVASRLVAERGPQDASPLISILVPTYRRPELLRQALLSALAQTAAPRHEIVVVDNDPAGDAGTLDTLGWLDDVPPLRYFVNQSNLGMTGNWNRCLELARGEWVTFLHDDDWLAPGFLAGMTPLLASDDVVLATCEVEVGTLDYRPGPLSKAAGTATVERLDTSAYILSNVSPAPGILSRAHLLREMGGFDDDYYPCSDYVAYVNVARRGTALRLRRKLAYYRTTDSATFKGDTLVKMIRFSRGIKRILLQGEPTLRNRAAYVASMAYWRSLARGSGVALLDPPLDLLDRLASFAGTSRVLRKLLGAGRRLLFPAQKARAHASRT